MDFCPKCETRLIISNKTSGNKELACPKCGFTKAVESEKRRPSKGRIRTREEVVTVIDEQESKIRTLPISKIGCPKCGNQEAYWWMVQTRGADESTTQFFRCTECNYTWREMA